MSSCKKRALPALASHKKWSVAPSTDPSSTVVAMVSTSVRASACSSMSAAGPSFHSATIESGAGSPLRSVNTTDAAPFVTSRWTSAADASSSRCASSTPSSNRRSRSPCWSAVYYRPKRRIAPATDRLGRNEVRDSTQRYRGRGMRRDDPFRSVVLLRAPVAMTSRARRVFPTPAAPVSTTLPLAESVALARAISSSRPTRGQRLRSGASPAGGARPINRPPRDARLFGRGRHTSPSRARSRPGAGGDRCPSVPRCPPERRPRRATP